MRLPALAFLAGACVTLIFQRLRRHHEERDTKQRGASAGTHPETRTQGRPQAQTPSTRAREPVAVAAVAADGPIERVWVKGTNSEMIKSIADHYGLGIDWLCNGLAMRLTDPRTGQTELIWSRRVPANFTSSAKMCDDKAACAEVLALCDIPHVAHDLFFTKGRCQPQWQRLLQRLQDSDHGLVLKLKTGFGGKRVFKAQTPLELERAWLALRSFNKVSEAPSDDFVVCPYVKVLREIRVFTSPGKVWMAYEKVCACLVGDGQSTLEELLAHDPAMRMIPQSWDAVANGATKNWILPRGETFELNWKHNLTQGARVVLVSVDSDEFREHILPLCLASCKAMCLRTCAVDVIVSQTERGLYYQVLEVNSNAGSRELLRQFPDQLPVLRECMATAIAHTFGLPYRPFPKEIA